MIGYLRKLKNHWESNTNPLAYHLRLHNDTLLFLNDKLGQKITLTHTGKKACVACGRDIKKTFQGGYCFPCTQKLAETDLCIVKPELCHFHQGTCRDAEFAQAHCFIPHVVYLAETSGIKVGITREHQKLTRWADQGASQAIVLAQVPDRKTSGLLEIEIAKNLNDKTNWRQMLMGTESKADLLSLKNKIALELPATFKNFLSSDNTIWHFEYPVVQYPHKVSSYNLDKNPKISDTLMGIKGQYLLFAGGVLNVRSFQGYEVLVD